MTDILSTILATKKHEVSLASAQTSLEQLQQQVANLPACRGFYRAIKNCLRDNKTAVIAEIKKASPSKGIISPNFNPTIAAISYAQAAATCLSVLTDVDYFQGHNDYLMQAKQAVNIPVLRKDFIIDAWQIYQSRVLGADCILLIVAALSDAQLSEFTALAQLLGMDVLIEVHDHQELQRALKTPAELIGINNRNLKTFVTSLQISLDMVIHVPDDRIVISESGIHTGEDIKLLKNSGIHAFLIGEAFMRHDNPGQALDRLLMS